MTNRWATMRGRAPSPEPEVRSPRSTVQGPKSKVQGPWSAVLRFSSCRAAFLLGLWALHFALLTLLSGGGCSTAPSPESRIEGPRSGARGPEAASDYDPARAFLALAQIEPVPPPPGQVPRQSRPLSARGTGYLQRAKELIAEERYTEATRALEKALRSDPASYEVHRGLAVAAHGAGNKERCRSHAAEAVRLNADDPASHYLLGRTAFDECDYGAAIRHFRTGLSCARLEPVPVHVVLCGYYLAKSLEAEGYLTAALHAYEDYEKHAARLRRTTEPTTSPATPTVPQELATLLSVNRGSAAGPISVIHERLGRFAAAADAWGRLVAQEEPDIATRLRYVRLLTTAGHYDDALAQCRLAAGASADPSELIELLAEVRRRTGAPVLVLDDVRTIVRERPDDRSWLLAYVDLLHRHDQHDAAVRILTQYVAAHPEASDVAWRLCDDYIRAGRSVEAVELAARMVAANHREYAEALVRVDRLSSDARVVKEVFAGVRPQGPAARYVLGALALGAGRTQQGTELLAGAIEAAADFAPARLALAEQLLAEYRWSEVVELLEAADRRNANLEWALGEAYAGLDDEEQAASLYSAAIRLNRVDTRSMFALAQLYERTDRPLRAQRQYEALLEVDPLHGRAREALVRLFVNSRLFEDAEAQVRQLRKLAASPNCIARCTMRIKLPRGEADMDQCRRALVEALEEGGPDADSLTFIALIDCERNDLTSAEKTLARALAIEPDHIDARDLLVSVYRGQLRFNEAASELRALLRRHPNRRRWVAKLFNVLMIQQDYDGAAEVASSFPRRRRLSEGALRAFRFEQLQALKAAKRFDERIAVVQAWLNEGETDRVLRAWLVEAHLDAGDADAALALVRQWYLADPDDAEMAEVYRDVLVRTGRYAAAKQLTLEAIEDDPLNETLQLSLIDVLCEAGQFDEALELVESHLRGTQQTFSFQIRQLRLYERAHRFSDVAALAGRMLQDDELIGAVGTLDRPVLRRQLAGALIGALLNDGRHDEARVKLTRWIDQTESSDDKFLYLTLLSGVYQQRGLAAEALESLELAHSLDPTAAGINNDLGYTLADRGERLDDAERMIRLAVAREPMNAAYLDSLGWVLYRRGRFDEARRWLLKAARTPDSLDDPVIYDHLGDACWRVGAPGEAVEHWKRALALAEERLQDRQDAVYRRVQESAGEKLKAAESGQPPKVASVAQERSEDAADRPTAGDQ